MEQNAKTKLFIATDYSHPARQTFSSAIYQHEEDWLKKERKKSFLTSLCSSELSVYLSVSVCLSVSLFVVQNQLAARRLYCVSALLSKLLVSPVSTKVTLKRSYAVTHCVVTDTIIFFISPNANDTCSKTSSSRINTKTKNE